MSSFFNTFSQQRLAIFPVIMCSLQLFQLEPILLDRSDHNCTQH